MYKLIQLFKSFTKRERLTFFISLAVFAVSATILSITVFYQSTVAAPMEGGAYVEGIVGQPIAINPLIIGDNDTDRDLVALLFGTLFDLSENIKTDEAQKIWTVTLKPELKWSDGEPLTSSDVIFTIGIIQDPDTRSPQFATWQGVIAERISEREVRLILKNPYAFFLDNIKNLRIAPQHIFDNIPPQNFRLSDFNLKPMGSGPYKFVSFKKRSDGFIESYALTVNKYYAAGKPFIRNLAVRFFAEKSEAINAFNAKEIDGLGGVDQSDLINLKIHHRVFSVSRPRYYAIFFNQSLSLPLKEKDVRRALAAAVDKQKLVSDVLGGQGEIAPGPLPPTVTGYDSAIYSNEAFSPDTASSTLEKAGWKIGEDGVRTKTIQKNPIKLEFDLIVPEVKFLAETAKIIQEDWKKIGVNLNPIVLKPSEVTSAAIKPRNYQMLIFGNTLNKNPDSFSFWHSSQRFEPGLNLSLYGNKTVDALLESVRQDLDPAARQANLTKIQTIINDEKPAIFLYSPKYLYVTSKNLGGFTVESVAAPADRFQDISGWYLKTARVFRGPI